MDKEKLPWRSFADRGAIAARWNPSATPTLYVLDRRGVIRYKWAGAPGARAIDAALDGLLQQAKAGGRQPPR